MEKYSLWLWKKSGKLGEFFLLRCGHPVYGFIMRFIVMNSNVSVISDVVFASSSLRVLAL